MFNKFKRKDKHADADGNRTSTASSVRGSHKLLSTRSSSRHHDAPKPETKRVNALEEARQARFNSTATTMLADDVEDVFYARGNGTELSARSEQLNSARSTTSSVMSYDDDDNASAYSGYSGYSGYSSASARSTDTYRSTTNGARATENLRATGLETLDEDQEDGGVDRSTARYVGAGADLTPAATTAAAATTASAYSHNYNYKPAAMGSASTTAVANSDALRQELAEMKQEMQAIRREMMNEMHTTRYDVLKEVTMLKGTISQLVSILQQSGGAHFDAAAAAVMGVAPAPPTPELSPDEIETMSRRTTTVASKTTKERITTAREDLVAPMLRTTSGRLTQLAPVDDSALSTPLHQEQIDDMFPLLDFSAEVQVQSRIRDAGTRDWVFDRVQEWLDSRFNVGSDVLLALVGDAGTGKTVAAAAVCDRHQEQVVAKHFCKFERKNKSSPRNVLLSMVNQLTSSLPMFKSQLARLNLKYVLEETDVLALARKVLIDPLNALEEPLTSKFIVIEGLDQCGIPNGYNDLLDFFSVVIPECPSWLGFLISTKPSPEFARKMRVTSMLDFSGKNASYVNDTAMLINDISMAFADEDQSEAKQILKTKSAGNYSYLEFTKQALTHSGMEVPEGGVPVDMLHDLPQSLYEIYEEIFEDKFGKGRTRLWRKALPVLQLIFTAASGPYAQITEQHVMDSLSYSKDDVRMLRRAFVDIIAIRHGTYHIASSALFDWLTDPQRKSEAYHVDVSLHVKVLRRVLRGDKLNMPGTAHGGGGSADRATTTSSSRSSPTSTESSSSNSSSDRSSGSHKQQGARVVSTAQPPKLHEPNLAPREKPVGILKRRA